VSTRRTIRIAATALVAALGYGCGGDGGDAADGGADSGDGLGAIEITGGWDGVLPDDATFDVAVFACPFTMPPESFPQSPTIDTDTGAVHDLVESVPPGEWCLMAFIDMIPDDDLQPVAGLDAVNATGAENEYGAVAVDVVAGETLQIGLVFEIQ